MYITRGRNFEGHNFCKNTNQNFQLDLFSKVHFDLFKLIMKIYVIS